ncbi:MAG: hypothetical protein IPP69_18225 [Flavobacteriales bacterium]|nr:hypothetical protein [Flavobacteriales bacterium]
MKKYLLASIILLQVAILHAQPVPASDENIPFLVTFGNEAGSKWGDDDNSQTFFFKIKKEFKEPISSGYLILTVLVRMMRQIMHSTP